MLRVYVIRATSEEAAEYVEELLRSIRSEPGVVVQIPRRRAVRAAAETQVEAEEGIG